MFYTSKNSMSKITTCTRWITCTGVPRKFGMVSLVGMPVNWRRLWESICLTFLTNNQTCFISLWVKVTALCYMVVSCLESGLGFLVQLLFGHVLVIPFFFFFHLFCQLVCIYYISRQYVLLGICYLDLFACNSLWIFHLFLSTFLNICL